MNEFDLINACFAPLATSPDAFGLKDDVAALSPPNGRRLIITTDTLVEGIHFLSDDPLESVAQKLIRVNVSDILAKGGTPWSAMLSLSWTQGRDVRQVIQFSEGLKADLEFWGISLMGGDTTSTTGPLVFSLTLIGHCAQKGPVLRSGGVAGDDIWVTGTIGDGAMGLLAVRGELDIDHPEDVALLAWRYRVPELPDFAIAELVSDHAHSSADVSDGLVADVGHIAKASGLKAVIDLDLVPVSTAAQICLSETQFTKIDLIVGGDDYQTVFTAPASAKASILRAQLQHGIVMTKIGVLEVGEGVVVKRQNGDIVKIDKNGWKHF